MALEERNLFSLKGGSNRKVLTIIIKVMVAKDH